MAIVVLRTAWAALLGVLVGTGVGLAATVRSGAVPPASFVLGTAVLALLCAVVAAVLPAVLAALRDPVAVLRTP